MGDARGRRRATAMLSATFVAISYNEASAQERNLFAGRSKSAEGTGRTRLTC